MNCFRYWSQNLTYDVKMLFQIYHFNGCFSFSSKKVIFYFRIHIFEIDVTQIMNHFWKCNQIYSLLCTLAEITANLLRIFPWKKIFRLPYLPYGFMLRNLLMTRQDGLTRGCLVMFCGIIELGQHWFRLWLLTALYHYLSQCSLTISGVLWHSPEGNFTGNVQDIWPWYELENY